MNSNTELIAELRDTASKGVSVWGDLQKEAADAIEALEAEVGKWKALSVTNILLGIVPGDGSGFEVYAKSVDDVVNELTELDSKAEDAQGDNVTLRAQLAAAQGKEPVCKVGSGWNSGGGFDVYDFQVQPPYGTKLYAATIPQQPSVPAPSVPEGWKLVPIEPTHLQAKAAADAWLGCDSKLYLNKAMAAAKAMLSAAPQPKDMK